MGKYGIGKRVTDIFGNEGVIIDKEKGWRMVQYDDGTSGWLCKSDLTALEDEPAESPNEAPAAPTTAGAPKFQVGDRVLCTGGFAKGYFGEIDGAAFSDAPLVNFFSWRRGHDGVSLIGDCGDSKWFVAGSNLQLAPLQIEAGKYYRRRDGKVVGPVRQGSRGIGDWPWSADNYGDSYRDDGSYGYLIGARSDHDLVEEVPAYEAFPVGTEVTLKGTVTGKSGQLINVIVHGMGYRKSSYALPASALSA